MKIDVEKYSHLVERNGKIYCILEGELDKADYENQCAKCPLKEKCVTVRSFTKAVPDDWHGVNTLGFYGDLYKNAKGKMAKDLRSIGKMCGLALCLSGDTKIKVRIKNDN